MMRRVVTMDPGPGHPTGGLPCPRASGVERQPGVTCRPGLDVRRLRPGGRPTRLSDVRVLRPSSQRAASCVARCASPAWGLFSRDPSPHLETNDHLSLIHISEPTRRTPTSYAVFCLK